MARECDERKPPGMRARRPPDRSVRQVGEKRRVILDSAAPDSPAISAVPHSVFDVNGHKQGLLWGAGQVASVQCASPADQVESIDGAGRQDPCAHARSR